MPDSGKTSSFLKAIDKYAKEQQKEMKQQLEEFKRQELQKAEAVVLRDAYHLIQKEMLQMKKSIAGEVSKKAREGKEKLFKQRLLITEKIFHQTEEKLLDFTKTENYIALMKKYAASISKVLKDEGTVLYICERDRNLSDEIKEAFYGTAKIDIDGNIKIGGIRGYNPNMGMIADETLDSKLEEQREWFMENSSLSIV